MLKTRLITAIVLLAIIIPAMFSQIYPAFAALALVFFAAAIWESQRFFDHQKPMLAAVAWTALYAFALWQKQIHGVIYLFGLCVGIWALRLTPTLAVGLPSLNSVGNRLTANIYNVAIFGCFIALISLFLHSPQYLLSCMALVWIADIGAYFSGKAFGRRKLAPSISPGKSWEGAIGGGIAVLGLSALAIIFAPQVPLLQDTFVVALQAHWGWVPAMLALALISAASVVGDLIESQLKRRIGMKDSSGLLPGHGGVLDRIDALLPVLPLTALLDVVFRMQ